MSPGDGGWDVPKREGLRQSREQPNASENIASTSHRVHMVNQRNSAPQCEFNLSFLPHANLFLADPL